MIVAIGGGEIRTRGTASIDRETIRLSKKKNPKLLFIPTASSDSERYWKRVQEYFGKFLKCRTDILLLIKQQPSKEQIRKKILSADIIYVGGGNTLQMMRVWRRLGVDKLIKAAYENGTVLSGISAGSIRSASGPWKLKCQTPGIRRISFHGSIPGIGASITTSRSTLSG